MNRNFAKCKFYFTIVFQQQVTGAYYNRKSRIINYRAELFEIIYRRRAGVQSVQSLTVILSNSETDSCSVFQFHPGHLCAGCAQRPLQPDNVKPNEYCEYKYFMRPEVKPTVMFFWTRKWHNFRLYISSFFVYPAGHATPVFGYRTFYGHGLEIRIRAENTGVHESTTKYFRRSEIVCSYIL